ncbi:MAG: nucleotidyltransferase domain-containing protein [Sulfolobaceae archaeon]
MDIVYTKEHWELLKSKRGIAIEVLNKLRDLLQNGFVYGSVARGDVNADSDIDIVVFEPNILKLDLLEAHHKFIVQPTPYSTPKAYISLDADEKIVISFPITKLRREELEFYWFGGILDYEGIISGKRVPGVNKRLELIIPTENGHIQLPLKGNEDYACKILKISVDTIRMREELLTKREERGHSGVFLYYLLSPEEDFQSAIRYLYKTNKFFRRVIDSRG